METKQSQIKINLPLKLKKKMEARADKYDMTLAGYVKHLFVNDLKSSEIPLMEASERTLKALKVALKEEKEGKLKKISNISDFFAKMSK